MSSLNISESRPVHVLALSGGGFRGLFTATILEVLEEQLGCPLSHRFDLICGTSVGGLLALGLALEIPASTLRGLFTNHGKEIFSGRKLGKVLIPGWGCAKHPADGIQKVLADDKIFGKKRIEDLLHPVLIPTVNVAKGLGQIFKTPHHPRFELDHKMLLTDVALATTAAPTFFPISRNQRGMFVDGGLLANAPGFFGYHEAKHFLNADPKQVRVLSIGTLSLGKSLRGGTHADKGILGWGKKLVELMLAVQEGSANYLLQHELEDRYLLVDFPPTSDQIRDISSLDKVSKRSIETLTNLGHIVAQDTLGKTNFQPFKTHQAAPVIFYHGKNANHAEENQEC